jgi:hypothetical protein
MPAQGWPPAGWEHDGSFPLRGTVAVEVFRGPVAHGSRPRLAHWGLATRAGADLGLLARRYLAGIATARDELILLDEGSERCRGARRAHRFLYTCLSHGLSLTGEHYWVVEGRRELHALSAEVPTAAWRELEPALRRVLRSFRGA